jgi:hypothetical protein
VYHYTWLFWGVLITLKKELNESFVKSIEINSHRGYLSLVPDHTL